MAAPQYIRMDGYVVVLTPHFLDSLAERRHLLCDARFDSAHWNKVWQVAQPNSTCGYALGMGYAYCRKVYNTIRGRWEMEYISFTPSDRFHTKTRTFAKMITV